SGSRQPEPPGFPPDGDRRNRDDSEPVSPAAPGQYGTRRPDRQPGGDFPRRNDHGQPGGPEPERSSPDRGTYRSAAARADTRPAGPTPDRRHRPPAEETQRLPGRPGQPAD